MKYTSFIVIILIFGCNCPTETDYDILQKKYDDLSLTYFELLEGCPDTIYLDSVAILRIDSIVKSENERIALKRDSINHYIMMFESLKTNFIHFKDSAIQSENEILAIKKQNALDEVDSNINVNIHNTMFIEPMDCNAIAYFDSTGFPNLRLYE